MSNKAAWLTTKMADPLEVKPAPYPTPSEKELVIKNGAVAISQFDWLVQLMGDTMLKYLKYPCILGTDVAGEVVAVGSGVSNFKVGDRVLAALVWADEKVNDPAHGGFQLYTVAQQRLVTLIPADMSYEQAAVLPSSVCTAGSALFLKDCLVLQLPTTPARPPTGKTLLVWGGSSSVGSNCIQLAVAAGYEVIATASPKNFDHVKKLGASQVFDYRKNTVVREVTDAVKDKTMVGAAAIGPGSVSACMDVLRHSTGRNFVVDINGPDMPTHRSKGMLGTVSLVSALLSWKSSVWVKSKMTRVHSKFVWGSDLKETDAADVIYGDFLPQALASHQYIAAPDPLVIGKGLQHIQAGINTLKGGVSAKKVVVSL